MFTICINDFNLTAKFRIHVTFKYNNLVTFVVYPAFRHVSFLKNCKFISVRLICFANQTIDKSHLIIKGTDSHNNGVKWYWWLVPRYSSNNQVLVYWFCYFPSVGKIWSSKSNVVGFNMGIICIQIPGKLKPYFPAIKSVVLVTNLITGYARVEHKEQA